MNTTMRHAFHVALTVAYPKWQPRGESLEQGLSRRWDSLVVRGYWRPVRPWIDGILLAIGIVSLIGL